MSDSQPTNLQHATAAVIAAARRALAMDNYCTVEEAGDRAGPMNYLRDAVDALDAAKSDDALPYVWACAACQDSGWVDERLGGHARSGWVECPECGNPHKGTHP